MADDREVCPCCKRVLWTWPDPPKRKPDPMDGRFPLTQMVPAENISDVAHQKRPRRKFFESVQYDGFRTLIREWQSLHKTTQNKADEWEILKRMHRCLDAIVRNPRGKA